MKAHLSIVDLAESSGHAEPKAAPRAPRPGGAVHARRPARDVLDELSGDVARLSSLIERRAADAPDWSTGGFAPPRNTRYDGAFNSALQEVHTRDQEDEHRRAREAADWSRQRRDDEFACQVTRQKIHVLRDRVEHWEVTLRELRRQIDAPIPLGQALTRKEVLVGAAAITGLGGAVMAHLPRAPKRPQALENGDEESGLAVLAQIAVAVGAVAAVVGAGSVAAEVGENLIVADRRAAISRAEGELHEARMALAALAPR